MKEAMEKCIEEDKRAREARQKNMENCIEADDCAREARPKNMESYQARVGDIQAVAISYLQHCMAQRSDFLV